VTKTTVETARARADNTNFAMRRALTIAGRYGTLIGLAALVAWFSFAIPKYFPTFDNFINLLDQCALASIIAAGLTIVLIAGEFDLSLGYHASLAGILVVRFIINGVPIPLAIVLVLAIGALVGLVNGLIVTQLRVNALITTLGIGTVLVGINYWVTGGMPMVVPEQSLGFLEIALGRLAGVPYPVYYMVAILVAVWLLLNRMAIGEHIQAVGGNVEAARLSGVRVDFTKTFAFVCAGVLAATTGILISANVGSGQITGADSFTLSSFAAVFLGSAVLREGEFHIVGTFVGVLTVAVGFNGLAIMGVASSVQNLFQGGLLVAAVALSTVARRLNKGS
jgi:ribose transport system permease protein